MHSLAAVSAIVPCFRCAGTVHRAVSSIAKQTQRPAEVILVDDHSGDETMQAMCDLQQQYGSEWIRIVSLTENSGPATARNCGWDVATKPYIAFLDADDSWHPKKIQIQFGWMRAHPEVAMTGHACRQAGSDSAQCEADVQRSGDPVYRRVSAGRLLLANQFPTPTVMVRRDLPNRFLPGKRHSEDYLLWLQIVLSGLPSYWCDLPLATLYKAHYGEAGLSADLWRMERGELNTYMDIHRGGYIGTTVLAALSVWSVSKYVRRVLAQVFTVARS